jgi:GT2 family glycosyltransferase
MMRRLFHYRPIQTDWTLWLDDDTYFCRGDWLSMLRCESRLRPNVDHWGLNMFVRVGEEHRQFVRESAWFGGRELEPDDQAGQSRINFVVGGFWAIRTRWIVRLDWPDPRLTQFGDDVVLGEALRQQGGRIGQAYSGVAINQEARRAPPETPRSEVLK